jgi:hypothetical protein
MLLDLDPIDDHQERFGRAILSLYRTL